MADYSTQFLQYCAAGRLEDVLYHIKICKLTRPEYSARAVYTACVADHPAVVEALKAHVSLDMYVRGICHSANLKYIIPFFKDPANRTHNNLVFGWHGAGQSGDPNIIYLLLRLADYRITEDVIFNDPGNEVARSLLELGASDTVSYGFMFGMVSRYGDVATLRAFNHPDNDPRCIQIGFQWACQRGAMDIVQFYLDNPQLSYRIDSGLSAACAAGQLECARRLLAIDTPQGWGYLIYDACLGGNMELITHVINNGGVAYPYGLEGALAGKHVDIAENIMRGADHVVNFYFEAIDEILSLCDMDARVVDFLIRHSIIAPYYYIGKTTLLKHLYDTFNIAGLNVALINKWTYMDTIEPDYIPALLDHNPTLTGHPLITSLNAARAQLVDVIYSASYPTVIAQIIASYHSHW
jgi:hypothetical protein